MRRNTLRGLLFAIPIVLFLSGTASAVPVNGSLQFFVAGGFIDTDSNMIMGGVAPVANATGDLAPLSGQVITLSSFNYESFAAPQTLWVANSYLDPFSPVTYSAVATGITVVNEASLLYADQVILAGTGVMNVTGFDATSMAWELVGTDLADAILYVNFTSENDGGGAGAGSGGAPVPEPSGFLAFALGLAIVRYRLKQ
jgi:hypothetical protein